jgi:hypothetical protein
MARSPNRPERAYALTVAGYKCLRDPHVFDLRGLTVLAGANSSGKSSALQPLLLLKQTLQAPLGEVPLRLSGPLVHFKSAREVLWRGRSDLSIGLRCPDYGTESTFAAGGRHGLVLHVPGLRGNPERSYPLVPASDSVSAGFVRGYVAGWLWSWQQAEADELRVLGDQLHELGLTWKVHIRKLNDVEGAVRVGLALGLGRRVPLALGDPGQHAVQRRCVADPGQLALAVDHKRRR